MPLSFEEQVVLDEGGAPVMESVEKEGRGGEKALGENKGGGGKYDVWGTHLNFNTAVESRAHKALGELDNAAVKASFVSGKEMVGGAKAVGKKVNGKEKSNDALVEKVDSGKLNSTEDNNVILIGTLAFSDRDDLRRHVIRGNWKFENPVIAAPPERFELIRVIPPEEDLKELPKDGKFNASFNAIDTKKEKVEMKTRAVPESEVKLTFKPIDESRDIFEVHGTGLNEFGRFELYGTAKKNNWVAEEDPMYSVLIHKRYVVTAPALTPAPPPASDGIVGEAEANDKKRKHVDAVGEYQARLTPT